MRISLQEALISRPINTFTMGGEMLISDAIRRREAGFYFQATSAELQASFV